MIFSTLNINSEEPIYLQLQNHIECAIDSGQMTKGSKLPSTREVSKILGISRNSVIAAYEELECRGIIFTKRGKGTFVAIEKDNKTLEFNIDWNKSINNYGSILRDLDIVKKELVYKKGMISFKSIAPEDSLFNIDEFKKAMMDAWAFEESNLLNYGYAKGYRPLINYFRHYMEEKGVKTVNKDILITNGFTEAFDMIISSLTNKGDTIICEEPTHNTAIKIMKSYGIKVIQIPMDRDGIIIEELKRVLDKNKIKFAYLIPSYNNPTGIVTKGERRLEIYNILREHNIPIIEDGFNEELLYSSSPIAPIASLQGEGNGVLYIGSLSKILFPGLRIGWILGDSILIDTLESVKRGRNIHSSFLDQSCFYYYLKSGAFSRYVKNVRKYYKDKFTLVMKEVMNNIEYEEILGEGGLHIFIKLKNNISSRKLLDLCYEDGVIFMPGDVFYGEEKGYDTFRIGFGRVSDEDIIKGIKIIGNNIKKLEGEV